MAQLSELFFQWEVQEKLDIQFTTQVCANVYSVLWIR